MESKQAELSFDNVILPDDTNEKGDQEGYDSSSGIDDLEFVDEAEEEDEEMEDVKETPLSSLLTAPWQTEPAAEDDIDANALPFESEDEDQEYNRQLSKIQSHRQHIRQQEQEFANILQMSTSATNTSNPYGNNANSSSHISHLRPREEDVDAHGEGALDLFESLHGPSIDTLAVHTEAKKKKRKRRGGGSAKHIPHEVEHLLGSANLHFINKEFSLAIDDLSEAIRIYPQYDALYFTLGLIYEELEQPAKAVEFYTIAAHMTPANTDRWRALGIYCVRHQISLDTAISAFKRVLARDCDDKEVLLHLSALYVAKGKPVKIVPYIAKQFATHPADKDLLRTYCQCLYLSKNTAKALEVMSSFESRFPQLMDVHLYNIMAEILMALKKHTENVALIDSVRTKLLAGQEFPIELQLRGAISSLLTDNRTIEEHQAAMDALNQLMDFSAEDFGDLQLAAAEALYTVRELEKALGFFEKIVRVQTYNQPKIWLRLAECYFQQRRFQQALPYAEMVVDVAPDDTHARLILTHIRTLAGLSSVETEVAYGRKKRRARGLPSEDQLKDTALAGRVRERMRSAREAVSRHDHRALVDAALPLVRNIAIEYQDVDVMTAGGVQHLLWLTAEELANPTTATEPTETGLLYPLDTYGLPAEAVLSLVGADKLALLACQLCTSLVYLGEALLAVTILRALASSTEPAFSPESSTRILYMAVECCHRANLLQWAFQHVKELIAARPDSTSLWNVYHYYLHKLKDNQQLKFLTRMKQRLSGTLSTPMGLLVHMAHHHASHSLAPYSAFSEYLEAIRLQPDNPVLYASIGIFLLQHAMSRRTTNRNFLIIEAFTFMQKHVRSLPPELRVQGVFNLGRAFHQLNILHLAEPYYRKILNMEHSEAMAPFRALAAYQLAHIYAHSEADGLARRVIDQYLVF